MCCHECTLLPRPKLARDLYEFSSTGNFYFLGNILLLLNRYARNSSCQRPKYSFIYLLSKLSDLPQVGYSVYQGTFIKGVGSPKIINVHEFKGADRSIFKKCVQLSSLKLSISVY